MADESWRETVLVSRERRRDGWMDVCGRVAEWMREGTTDLYDDQVSVRLSLSCLSMRRGWVM